MSGEQLEDKIIFHMERLGLSNYEVRVYLSLLRNGPSYGNEVRKDSGVPGPKVYETLERLVEKGLAYPTGSDPVHYQALPFSDFLQRKQREFLRVTRFLEEHQEYISKARAPTSTVVGHIPESPDPETRMYLRFRAAGASGKVNPDRHTWLAGNS